MPEYVILQKRLDVVSIEGDGLALDVLLQTLHKDPFQVDLYVTVRRGLQEPAHEVLSLYLKMGGHLPGGVLVHIQNGFNPRDMTGKLRELYRRQIPMRYYVPEGYKINGRRTFREPEPVIA